MTISAKMGPYIAYRSNPLGSVGNQSANQNPESGPSFSGIHGTALLDARYPFTYNPGQRFGQPTYCFLSADKYQCIDQVPSALSANNIATTQQAVTATALTLVSSSGGGITVGTSITRADTGATVTGLLAIDTATSSVSCGEQGTMRIWDPTTMVSRNIRITTNGDDSGAVYTVVGYDLYGYPLSEAITGPNNTVASGAKAFKYITSVTPVGTINSTSVTVGTGDVYGLPIRADRISELEVWWGTPQSMVTGGGGVIVPAQQALTVPLPVNSAIANSAVYSVIVPFDFTVVRAAYVTEVAVTTGSKLATLTLGINGTAMTGGVISLTSAAMTPSGAIVPATNITAGNTARSSYSAVTITIATPGVITWPAHGLTAGTPVVFATTGALPTGLTAGTVYYVISSGLATNSFQVSATSGGSAVNTSGSQSGTHTATAYNEITCTVSSVTAFVEGSGYLEIIVANNSLGGGTFTAAVTTTASTTTGDVRGTVATPDNSDGTKRLTIKVGVLPSNIMSITGQYGVAQNLANNNGT